MAASRSRKDTSSARSVTPEAIAYRAYEISESEFAGSPEENWLRAEHELGNPPPAARRRSSPRANALGQPSAAT
jgi:hypothetical protein